MGLRSESGCGMRWGMSDGDDDDNDDEWWARERCIASGFVREMLCLGCGVSWVGCLSWLIVGWIMLRAQNIVLLRSIPFSCDKGCRDSGGGE